MKSKSVRRKERREALENISSCCELLKIIRHFFPDLITLLKQVKDTRHQSYINYKNHVILFVRILAVIFHIGSMRKLTGDFNNKNCIENVAKVLNLEELQEIPHWETINGLSMDSLYACNPVFDICKKNNWCYIIRFKDGSIPSVAEEFHILKTMEAEQIFTKTESGITKTYKYVTNIPYKSHSLNAVEYTRSDLQNPFVFLTDLPISDRNYEQLVEDGRRRWKIENEGFNTQKNHGYELEHLFSEDYTAMKNHYLLIQIGHMIAQFFTNALDIWKLLKIPLNEIFQILKQSFKTTSLTEADILLSNKRRQYRFH